MDAKVVADALRLEVGRNVDLRRDFDPRDTLGCQKPEDVGELLEDSMKLLRDYQERLYAEDRRGLLVVLQAMDTAGKDSTIEHVMSGINPQGCHVTSFKVPSAEELDHDFLWRVVRALPARGMIGIFNRSHYEEVLVVRVHPELLERQKLPPGPRDESFWQQRFESINDMEKHLVRNGFEIVKIYLNLSRAEQCRRQLDRIDTPSKQWKFKAADIEERRFWDAYIDAYQEVLNHTTTPWAPWYVVPADHKWFSRLAVASILVAKLEEMAPQFPTPSDAEREAMAACRELLLEECPADRGG